MSEEKNNNQAEKENLSRRKFLRNSGIAVGGLAVGGVLGSVIPWNADTAEDTQQQQEETKNFNQALMYFNQAEFRTIEAATERIFPQDDNGPGARELGVAYYIDHQLAGAYGFNARDYMQPPFFHGEKEQGYQGRLNRREIYRIGIREMQNYSHQNYDTGFTELSEEDQDKVLTDFADEKVNITTISPGNFFQLMRSMTLEGVYSDPLYGGNKDMDGWKMRDYPGNQMNYTDIIEGEFKEIPPNSLRDHM